MREFNVWWNTKLMRHMNPSITLWLSSTRRPFFVQYHKAVDGHRYWDWWVFRLHLKPKKRGGSGCPPNK